MAVLDNRPQEASNFDPIEVCPLLFTTRLSTARMLIELEEWEKATNVLNGLIEEDDEIVDPWYLLGKTKAFKIDYRPRILLKNFLGLVFELSDINRSTVADSIR